jgi:hypothetical protein
MLLDRYARDARTWRQYADFYHKAADLLFNTRNPFDSLVAATLGHNVLEMYLKAALICEGMVVFNRRDVGKLDTSVRPAVSDCAWGHKLVCLATLLSSRNRGFDLSDTMNISGCTDLTMPITIKEGIEIFDPFFFELRYPSELRKLEGKGVAYDEKLLLAELVQRLQPFVNCTAEQWAAM